MPVPATESVNTTISTHADSSTPLKTASESFMLASYPVSRREIAAFIATDGLPFLAYEENWDDAATHAIYNQIDGIEQRLTGVDCQSYVSGMTQYLDEPEKLQSFVISYTRALLSRWQII